MRRSERRSGRWRRRRRMPRRADKLGASLIEERGNQREGRQSFAVRDAEISALSAPRSIAIASLNGRYQPRSRLQRCLHVDALRSIPRWPIEGERMADFIVIDIFTPYRYRYSAAIDLKDEFEAHLKMDILLSRASLGIGHFQECQPSFRREAACHGSTRNIARGDGRDNLNHAIGDFRRLSAPMKTASIARCGFSAIAAWRRLIISRSEIKLIFIAK